MRLGSLTVSDTDGLNRGWDSTGQITNQPAARQLSDLLLSHRHYTQITRPYLNRDSAVSISSGSLSAEAKAFISFALNKPFITNMNISNELINNLRSTH